MTTGVYLVDRERRIVFWNDGAERISGFHPHEAIGRCCGDGLLVHSDERNVAMCGSACPLTDVMRDGHSRSATVFLRHRDGYRVPVRIHAFAVRDGDGHIVGAAESFDEVRPESGAAQLEEIGEDGCLHDFDAEDDGLLTAGLLDNLDEFARRNVPFSVLCIQLHGVDHIRTKLGRQAAEKMLWVVAQTLSTSLGATDLIRRLQADRLAVILEDCPREAIAEVAGRLKDLSRLASIQWWGDNVSATLSIGGAAAHPGDTPESIMNRAKQALDACIASGGDHVNVA
jgi:diguanylate cyclase (GGDEF)-like protein/PAS domain S-box-containing protein